MATDFHKALELIYTSTKNCNQEVISIENASSRVLAHDVYACVALPRFHNSAMDGYAIKLHDAGKTIECRQTVLAGSHTLPHLQNGTCIKVMTGAQVPHETEAIVPIEDVITEQNSKMLTLPKNIKKDAHIRFIGEDIKEGELLISKNQELHFAHITLLASQGISHITVYKKPTVALFSSGEELKPHFETIDSFQIYNSNTPTFMSRAKELGCEVSYKGSAKDSVKSIKNLIKNSLDSDLIVTSGGMSVGDADFTKEAFEQLPFEVFFDGVVLKPGKPTLFGKIGSTFVLSLPGNPLASALVFEIFGKAIIQKLKGASTLYHQAIQSKLKYTLNNKPGRVTLIPGYFDGEFFTPSQKRSPGMVNILSHCNGMIVLDKDVSSLKKNSTVQFLPINWPFFSHTQKDFISYE